MHQVPIQIVWFLFNTLFWSAVALLDSDFDVIYLQAVILLGIILDRVSFHDKAVQHVFLASRPKQQQELLLACTDKQQQQQLQQQQQQQQNDNNSNHPTILSSTNHDNNDKDNTTINTINNNNNNNNSNQNNPNHPSESSSTVKLTSSSHHTLHNLPSSLHKSSSSTVKLTSSSHHQHSNSVALSSSNSSTSDRSTNTISVTPGHVSALANAINSSLVSVTSSPSAPAGNLSAVTPQKSSISQSSNSVSSQNSSTNNSQNISNNNNNTTSNNNNNNTNNNNNNSSASTCASNTTTTTTTTNSTGDDENQMDDHYQKFYGIQPMLIKGLLSTVTEPSCIDVIIKISELPLNEIFHPDTETRLLTTILVLQPWLCVHTGDAIFHSKCRLAANYLSKACDESHYDELSHVYSNFPNTQSAVGVFLVEWCTAFSRIFFPQFGVFTFMMMTELLNNGPMKYHRAILYIFQLLIKCTDINLNEFNPKIPQWFGCVSKYISSEIWKEALVGLESAVEQAPLHSNEIDIASLRPFKMYRKVTPFANEIGDGNRAAANAIENILSFGDSSSSKSENKISPRAFSKFFSEDDMGQESDHFMHRPHEEDSESGEEIEDSFEEDISHGHSAMYGHPNMVGFGFMDGNHDWSGGMGVGGFNSFSGLDDILADLHKEKGEGSDLDSLSSFENRNIQ